MYHKKTSQDNKQHNSNQSLQWQSLENLSLSLSLCLRETELELELKNFILQGL